MLTGQGPSHNDALHRLGHVEPGTANGRVERHHSMLKEPLYQVIRQMPRQIIQDQDDAQGRLGSARRMTQPRFPLGTERTLGFRWGCSCSISASTLLSCSLSQGCKTALVTETTPLARTWPVAGRKSVSSLAVPPRSYSCGCSAGWPSGCHEAPGCGIA